MSAADGAPAAAGGEPAESASLQSAHSDEEDEGSRMTEQEARQLIDRITADHEADADSVAAGTSGATVSGGGKAATMGVNVWRGCGARNLVAACRTAAYTSLRLTLAPAQALPLNSSEQQQVQRLKERGNRFVSQKLVSCV